MEPAILKIVGVPGSPYSRKLRAVLRYRRIPHVWIMAGSKESRGLPRPRVELLPQLILPAADGQEVAQVDSTPLIRELEVLFQGRSVIPEDPALNFIDLLLEDFADEWLTKAMFHYRWAFAPDAAHAARILPRWQLVDRSDDLAETAGQQFSARQIGRLGVVGSNPTTAPVIEASYERVLRLLDARLASSRFLLGNRPGASDFGFYGQLTQLAAFDPTSMAITLEVAPRIVAWVDVVEDLSGLEPSPGEWITADSPPETVRALLGEVGRVYVPFLLANARAVAARDELVECRLDGQTWVQKPFPYQAKCLDWLRKAYADLPESSRAAVDSVLLGTGCEAIFAN